MDLGVEHESSHFSAFTVAIASQPKLGQILTLRVQLERLKKKCMRYAYVCMRVHLCFEFEQIHLNESDAADCVLLSARLHVRYTQQTAHSHSSTNLFRVRFFLNLMIS